MVTLSADDAAVLRAVLERVVGRLVGAAVLVVHTQDDSSVVLGVDWGSGGTMDPEDAVDIGLRVLVAFKGELEGT